ncbi:hypothetical protein ABW21_db0204279 [Orbilia brochopaga]|nr:hypothetical protein ABW21_db0204279 [Drechslerella brochopaga]
MQVQPDNKPAVNNATIKLQLANTIFQTGRTTTAAHHSYAIENSPRKHPCIANLYQDNLENITVKLHPAQKFNAVISWSLRELTPPRKIESSNGNIIKEILAPDITGSGALKRLPASRELEAAVQKWLDNHPRYDPATMRKYPLEVYAGIIKAPELNGKALEPEAAILSYRLNICGCTENMDRAMYKFAKVVSGGGGWGSHAGLVALDPDGMEGFKIPGEEQLPEVTKTKSILGDNMWVQFFLVDPTIQQGRRSRAALGEFTLVSHRDMDQETWDEMEDICDRFESCKGSSETKTLKGTAHDGEAFQTSGENVPQSISEDIVSTKECPSRKVAYTESASKETLLKATASSSAKRLSFPRTGVFVNGNLWVNDQKIDAPYTSVTLTLSQIMRAMRRIS